MEFVFGRLNLNLEFGIWKLLLKGKEEDETLTETQGGAVDDSIRLTGQLW